MAISQAQVSELRPRSTEYGVKVVSGIPGDDNARSKEQGARSKEHQVLCDVRFR